MKKTLDRTKQSSMPIRSNLEELIRERTAELERSRKAALSMMQDANMEKQRAEEAMIKLSDSEKHLKSAILETEKANRSKSEFLANMSHEIRTPIHAISGMTHLLQQTGLNEKQHGYTEKILVASKNLLHIIDDILDFSKVESGKYVLENYWFRLDNALNDAISMNITQVRDKNLEMIVDSEIGLPPVLKGDSMRLIQILNNLISNAIKFTDKGEIVLSIRVLKRLKRVIVLRFAVRDTGIGMTAKQQKTVMDAFIQADASTTRKYGGTGLGLAICRKLVELMGGRFEVKSRKGKGTTVSFDIPLSYSGTPYNSEIQPGKITDEHLFHTLQHDTEQIRSNEKILKNMRILLAEDNPLSREILTNSLSSIPCQVDTAANGTDVIQIVLKKHREGNPPYDLLILDWKMPGMDGIETYRQLNDCPEIRPLPPCVLMSAYDDNQFFQEAVQAGIHTMVSKPVSYPVLIGSLAGLIAGNDEIPSAAVQSEGPPKPETDDLTGVRILLVEDNEINQQVTSELLESNGLHAEIACNGMDAYEKYTSQPDAYDLILMDIQMPILDGYKTTHKLRHWEKKHTGAGMENSRQKIPIIAMSADVLGDTVRKCFSAGMNDYISKPVDPRKLFDLIARNLLLSAQPLSIPSQGYKTMMTKQTIPPEFSSIKTLDVRDGLRRITYNIPLYRKLLIMFWHNYQNFQNDLENSLVSDLETAIRLSHTLKGVAGNIGAVKIHEAAELLENRLKRKPYTADPELIGNLVTHLSETLRELSPLVSNAGKSLPEKTPRRKIDPEAVKTKFRTLAKSIADSNTESASLVADLQSYRFDPVLLARLEELHGLVSNYDFEDAGECLKKIMEIHNPDFPGVE
ncbi:response regulator [bacterium]|nr:response regulator [bacterium]